MDCVCIQELALVMVVCTVVQYLNGYTISQSFLLFYHLDYQALIMLTSFSYPSLTHAWHGERDTSQRDGMQCEG